MGSNEKRIVVFTGDFSHAVRKGIVEIDRALPNLSWLILIHTLRKRASALLRSQWRNLQRNGRRWIPYTVANVGRRIFSGAQAATPARGPGREFADLSARANMRILRAVDIHAPESLAAVREFAPDLGLSLAAPILREPLFSLPRLGTLNLHKGKLPDYRGMPPAFWELWNDEQSVGCTVHEVDAKLDTGRVICAASVERETYSPLRGLQLRLDELGISLMREATAQCLAQSARPQPQAAGGKTYRKPTLAQVAALERRFARNDGPATPLPMRALKGGVQSAAFQAFRVGGQQVLAPRITVLLYHHVSDSARDNLTVGIAQFERQMRLLRLYCNVWPIEEVIACRSVPRSKKPTVCVTFDDGYLDSFSNAAPILQRHNIPCAFFISTGLIGTQGAFPHDVRRGNAAIAVMSWDNLRQLQRDGFTIGSHSVSHIDCAAEPEHIVRAELTQSQADLRRELGLKDIIFAYPYGGRQHMSAARLELVKQLGFDACLSVYGGSNVNTVDRFNVLRRGIHWEFSDRAFLYQGLGL